MMSNPPADTPDDNNPIVASEGQEEQGTRTMTEEVEVQPDAKEEVEAPKVEEPSTDPEPTNNAARRRTTIHIEAGTLDFDVDVPEEFLLANSTNRRALAEDDEFLQAKGEDVKIWLPVRRIKSHTCQCCGIMCGLWVLSFAVLIVFSLALGAIEFNIGVPFYDRSEINEQREDAYLATQRDADYVATIQQMTDGSTLCVHKDPTVITRNGTLIAGPAPGENCQLASTQMMRILYISSDRKSNILTTENLEQIKKIEEDFLNRVHLPRYCHFIATNATAFTTRDVTEIVAELTVTLNATEQNYRSCARINSALNFMDELYFFPETGLGYHLLTPDKIPQEYDLEQTNIDSVVDFWGSYTAQNYDMSTFPAAVQTVGEQVTIPNLFYSVTSSDFQVGSDSAVGLISSYAMGLPINEYASSSQLVTEQYEATGVWLWEEYDSFLKSAGFDGVDVYFSDTEGAMSDQEQGYLAIQSFMLLPFSIIFVLLYLMYMQDSVYIGAVGVMQILLCFIPGLIIYTYIFQIKYLGVLNLIAIYIIMGIGVDDLFVFCDQWKHHAHERRFDQRLQKSFNVASRAMFTTSCTTFIAFISNAASAFPAIRTFGIFAAVLVLVNFSAISLFFPAAFGVYFKSIRTRWYDHPSRLFCCNRKAWTDDVYHSDDEDTVGETGANAAKKSTKEMEASASAKENAKEGEGAKEDIKDGEEKDETIEAADDLAKQEDEAVPHAKESALVWFFREKWAPVMIKLRFIIVLFYMGIFAGAVYFASRLEPDETFPNTLPEDNNYRLYNDVLVEYFARSGNPLAIKTYFISGIDPDKPIDRTGTDDTNTTDYGTANYVDCSVYDPTTPEAQVWSLQTCQDMFFGNVTDYHRGSAQYQKDGLYGPRERRIMTDRVPETEAAYKQLVSCPHQGFRDWLLTDFGCTELQRYGLPCHDETSARPDCITWDTDGNSCEPFPVPQENWSDLYVAFLLDPNLDPATSLSNYDKYYREIFAAEIPDLNEFQQDQILRDDFSCRMGENLVLLAISSTGTLDQSIELSYEEGIALYNKWDEWSKQMLKSAPREMAATMQTSNGAWSYYFLNETLISETFTNIALSLVLSFIVLSVIGGNPIMAFFSVATIGLIVTDIFAFTVLMGFKLGVLEAVNYVVVIGLSIDYTVHLSEAYTESHATDRHGRVTGMLEEMGVSVLSGAISTLGACFFMFFAPNIFFVRFATFIFATIFLSCFYSLTFFPAMLAIIGPTGNVGNCCFWGAKRWRQFKHRIAMEYIETEEFKRREMAQKYKSGEIETMFEC